jgi:hypothetical protein
MTDPTHRHDAPDEEPRFDVGDHHSGRTRLLSRQCATCIFRPGNPMHLSAGRLQQLIADARAAEGYIICHDTLPHYRPGTQPAICRGFHDRYDTQALQVIRRLWGFLDIEPPPADDTTGPPP